MIWEKERKRGRGRELRKSKKARKIYVPVYMVIAYPLRKLSASGLRNCPNEMQKWIHLQHMH